MRHLGYVVTLLNMCSRKQTGWLFMNLLFGCLVILYTIDTYQNTTQKLNLLKAKQATSALRFEHFSKQTSLLDNQSEQFVELAKKGLFKPLDRIKLTDDLIEIQTELKLQALKIQIDPRNELDALDSKQGSDDVFGFRTRLHVEFKFYSDLDFVRFFKLLNIKQTGLWDVEHCQVTKKNGALDLANLVSPSHVIDPLFTADCRVSFYEILPNLSQAKMSVMVRS